METGLCAGVSGAGLVQPWLELVSLFLQNPLDLGSVWLLAVPAVRTPAVRLGSGRETGSLEVLTQRRVNSTVLTVGSNLSERGSWKEHVFTVL